MSHTKGQFGVAFSGGGIRSAAFCSGVLRRLITRNAEPDYLSCVSGGGYTGSAYIQWKYSNGNHVPGSGNDPATAPKPASSASAVNWTNKFFNHMRERSGYIFNWNKGCLRGCCDALVFGVLLFFVALVIPIFGWGSFACPIAFVVKLLYGRYVDGTLCRKDADSIDCKERTGLFVTSISVFVAFYFLEYLIRCCDLEKKENYLRVKCVKIILKLVQLISGTSFAFTFLPWFIKDFLKYTHLVYRIAIVVVTALFWFFVPILRRYSSLVILIYLYSYVVYWHLYEETMFNIKYTQERFLIALGISLIILAFASAVGDFQLRLVHVYNRWRLQKAFYYHVQKENSCSGIGCHDIFPGCYCAPSATKDKGQRTSSQERGQSPTAAEAGLTTSAEERGPASPITILAPRRGRYTTAGDRDPNIPAEKKGLITAAKNRKTKYLAVTLDDCKEVEKPVYISNMVANGWRKNYKEKYCLLTMSPKGIAVLDRQEEEEEEQLPERDNRSPRECVVQILTSGQDDSLQMQDVLSDHPRQSPTERQTTNDDHEVASVSSVITIQPNDSWLHDEQIGKRLTPDDIKLSSAMAMSAAAVSPSFGAIEGLERPLTHILTVFGFEMAATIVYDMKDERRVKCCPRNRRKDEVRSPNTVNDRKGERSEKSCCCPCGKICCCCSLNSIIFLAFVLCGLIVFCINSSSSLDLPDPVPVLNSAPGIIIIICLCVLWVTLPCIAFPDCSSCCLSGKCTAEMEKSSRGCSRWSAVHFPIYRFVRFLLNIITVGPYLPGMLHLSDGGHFENYGLLPLLKLKLPKILVADGSHIKSDEDYGQQITHAMKLARDILHCSFTAKDGGDVLSDIQKKYLKPQNGEYPRKYEFNVQYNEIDPLTGKRKEGHITLIAPRPPSNDIQEKTWKDVGEGELNTKIWGKGPFLSKDDVDHIAGCPAGVGCCECCHNCCCSRWRESCSSSLVFPRHSTANQFFTPTMFAAYHREGYRACMECDEFLAT